LRPCRDDRDRLPGDAPPAAFVALRHPAFYMLFVVERKYGLPMTLPGEELNMTCIGL
jgi:hypothetical protein